MNEPTMSNPRSVLERLLRRATLRWRARGALENLFACLLALTLVAATASWVIEAQRFDPDIVRLARALVGALVLLAICALLISTLRMRRPARATARYLEQHQPALDGLLLTAVGATDEAGLWRGVVERAVAACERLDVVDAAERTRLRRAAALLAGLMLLLTATISLAPAGLRHAVTLLLPWSDTQTSIPYRLAVSPGSVTVIAGSDLRVLARSEGFSPTQASLVWRRPADAVWTPLPMLDDGDGGFEALVFEIGADIEYRVQAEGVRSAAYRVSVLPRPVVERIDITYHYPAATGRTPEVQIDAGVIAAVRGTRAQLSVRPQAPVAAGRLLVDGEPPQTLTADADGNWAGSIDVLRDGHYRVELDAGNGRFTPATPEYPIHARVDAPPVVEIRRPGRDTQVTAIEELEIEVSARDDVIVRDLELVISVNGGEHEILPLAGEAGLPSVLASHVLVLEERGLEPGDLVAFHARAADGEGEGVNRSSSDLYFLEVRPFDRVFRRSEGGGGGGAGGGEQQAGLAEQQRELVVALFNVQRDGIPDADLLRERSGLLAQAQERVRDRTEAIIRRLGTRPVVEMNPGYRAMADELPRASAAMLRVEALLAAHDIGTALEPARAALRHLQRADAAFREVQVARQNGAGGGQAGASEAGDLANLFALEMDRFSSQYAGVQRGRWQQPGDRELDDLAEQLRRLAERQQREVERLRQRRLQAAAGAGGVASQQQLAEEIERLQRELQRLSLQRPEQQALADALQRAGEAARQMRAAGEQGSEQAGQEALDELRAAARALAGASGERLADGVDDAREGAGRLAEEQRELSEAAARGRPRGTTQERLAQKNDMASRLAALGEQVERLAGEAREASAGASGAIREAADTLQSSRLAEAMRRTRSRLTLDPDSADPRAEALLADALESAHQRLAEAGEALRGRQDGATGEGDMPAELASLVEQLERAGRRLASGESQGEAGDSRGGASGAAAGGEAGQQAGSTPSAGGSAGAVAGGAGGSGAGSAAGGAFPGAVANGGRGGGAGAWGEFRGSLDTRARQLDALRRTLPPDSAVARDIAAVVAGLLDIADDQLASPAHALERHGEMLERLRRIRTALADATGESAPPLVARGEAQAPAGWETLVEAYFRALAATPR